MNDSLSVSFHGVPTSPALLEYVEHEAAHVLERDRHTRHCHVFVEPARSIPGRIKRYQVRIELTGSGGEVFVSRPAPLHQGHDDAYLAVREAFKKLARRLERQKGHRRATLRFERGPRP